MTLHRLARRQFLKYVATSGLWAYLKSVLPTYALPALEAPGAGGRVPGAPVDLYVRWSNLDIGERRGRGIAINDTVPGPLIRLRQGEVATIRVHNELDEASSIHWHGLLLPFEMDGVPGVSYEGIKPGETFTYRFPVQQSGTYWYHSHTGLQEQLGVYGPLIIDPLDRDPVAFEREYVVVLSDWTFENPYRVLAKLKKMSSYYNFNKRTVGQFFKEVSSRGLHATLSDRLAWGRMRMSPTDLADITGSTYSYLLNGMAPETNWTGLFLPGERIRLRIINAATMTYFNVRIPGLEMSVVQADGQNVEPVTVEELQVAVAETFDVIVQPREDRAYTLFAESMDRSGYARGTLAPRPGMIGPLPDLREPPLRSMVDMGMDMEAMGGMERREGMGMPSTATETPHHGRDVSMSRMSMQPVEGPCVPGITPCTGPVVGRHRRDTHGAGNASVPRVLRNRLGEPGIGLAQAGHRVLVYKDLRRLVDDFDERPVDREVELHLTGNMERYMWSFDGRKFSQVTGPIEFVYGERLRLILVNDTMMEHPIHLHGMWMELENGRGHKIPRKHTINLMPASRVSALITADAPGRWAFHCHLLYHMEMGMFRVVRVS